MLFLCGAIYFQRSSEEEAKNRLNLCTRLFFQQFFQTFHFFSLSPSNSHRDLTATEISNTPRLEFKAKVKLAIAVQKITRNGTSESLKMELKMKLAHCWLELSERRDVKNVLMETKQRTGAADEQLIDDVKLFVA